MLKHNQPLNKKISDKPAAFGRLCVETSLPVTAVGISDDPAAFGRLCVETGLGGGGSSGGGPAAFGRLCVETHVLLLMMFCMVQPPSGGCVLKPLPFDAEIDIEASRLRAAVC